MPGPGLTVVAWTLLALAGPALPGGAGTAEEMQVHTDPDSGLITWHWQGEGLSLELAQRLPDQTRAFFLGRGFDTEDATFIAGHCVFQGVLRNTDRSASATVDLRQWRSQTPNGATRPLPNRDWQDEWASREVPEVARIAFRWALFPGEHRFQPGDWLMGMIVFKHPPSTTFDLTVHWRQQTTPRQSTLPDLRCAGEPERDEAEP